MVKANKFYRTLSTVIFIVFLFNFIINNPFIWTEGNKEILFTLIFIIVFIFLLSKNSNIRFLLVLSSIVLIYLGGVFFAINNRYRSSAWAFVHDSVLQNEIAGRYLLLGKNPYVEDYLGSGLENVPFGEGDRKTVKNPALYHLVTLPFLLLLNTLPQIVFTKIFGFFDGRFIYTLGLLLFIILLIKHFKKKDNRSLLFILFFLNPMTAKYFIDGRNDLFVTFLLFSVLYMLDKKKYIIGGFIYALAMATKLTTWLFAPFLFTYLFFSNKTEAVKRFFLSSFILSTVLFSPFILWDAKALVNDTVGYFNAGGIKNYPITGYGFSKLLLKKGIINSSYDYFPFWIIQLLFGIPTFIFLIKKQIRNNTLGYSFLNYGVFLFIFWYFSHHFNDSYFIYLSQVFTLAYFLIIKQKNSKNYSD